VAAALGHAVTAAGARITVRSLGIGSRSAHVGGVIVLSAGCVSAAAAGLVCLLQRSFVLPQQPAHWVLMAAVGVVGYLHQTTMTAGLQRVPVSTASSLTYLSIVWSLLADWLLFKHPPSGTSLGGAALICGGGLLVALWRMRSGFDHGGGGAGRSPNKEKLSKEQLSVLRM
jgi:drug/metabolite transporter (DMT)-like permease